MDIEARKLSALREELRRDLEALERVEKLIASKNGSLLKNESRKAINVSVEDQMNLADDAEMEAPASSLRGTIESTINADLSVRWTNQKMLTYLKTTGFPLKAQKPIYSIGQAMQKLADSGKIRLVRKGLGNQPNIYRGKPAESPSITEGPSAAKGGEMTESVQAE